MMLNLPPIPPRANMDADNADSQLAQRLLTVLAGYQGGVVVALSGGIDSTVVTQAAYITHGPNAVAATADSPSVPRAELALAREIAAQIGIRHLVLPTQEFANAAYQRNDGTRCYYCKSELYDRIHAELPNLGINHICSGANVDDLGDYRPGLSAAAERNIRHPLIEAGFRKVDVRQLARYWNIAIWDKPASPCLSSRLAPGVTVTPERTLMIEQAEIFLKSLGIRDGRVRLHEGELARIEVPLDEIARLAEATVRDELSQTLRQIGFRYITLDLQGFRSGSLNNLIPLELRSRHMSASSQE